MKRILIFLLLFTMVGSCFPQDASPSPKPLSLFSDKPRFALVEGKAGRSFLKTEEVDGSAANVFFGSVGLNYGIAFEKSLFGIGFGAEYVDLIDNAFSFPLYVMFRQYLGEDSRNGWFMAVKAGWIVGGKKSFSTFKEVDGFQPLTGNTVRSMNGPYGEVLFGYSVQRFDIFVSYHYREIHYDTKYIYYYNPFLPNCDVAWRRSMHTVMGGVGFRLF